MSRKFAPVTACRHCGTPLTAGQGATGYCCAGCATVGRLLAEHGLERFYDLRGGTIAPVAPSRLEPRDFAWLSEAAQKAESTAPAEPNLELALEGVSCLGCVWLAEQLFSETPGGRRLDIDPAAGRLRVFWQTGAFDIATWATRLQQFGYLVGPARAGLAAGRQATPRNLRLGLAAFFAMQAMTFSLPAYFGMAATFPLAGLFSLLAFLFATLSLLACGHLFFLRAAQGLRHGHVGMDLPIALGLSFGYAGSVWAWLSGHPELAYFDFVSVFTFLMLIGRWVQEEAVARNRQRLLAFDPALQRFALVPEQGEKPPAIPLEVPGEALAAGQPFIVRPGQTLPVRSRTTTAASFALSSITGEPTPVVLEAGRSVPSGAVLAGAEPTTVVAEEGWQGSLLQRLLAAAQQPQAWRDRTLDHILAGAVLLILSIAVAGALAWTLLAGQLTKGLHVALAVVVVSCPCALGVALPLLHEWAVARLRGRGVYVRAADLWGRLGRVRQVVFDKTGTLTLELPALAEPARLGDLPPDAHAALHALVADNHHPAARALQQALAEQATAATLPRLAGQRRETVGLGVELVDETGRTWRLGRPVWAAPTPPGETDTASDETLVLARDGQRVMGFVLTESLRPGAAEAVASLRQRGVGVRILSGDRVDTVARLAQRLNLPAPLASGGQSPTDKAEALDEAAWRTTLMVGDGANDALAFAKASIRGTPVVGGGPLQEASDFYLLGHRLDGVAELFRVADDRRRAVRRMVAFAVTYNAATVGLALAGWMHPLLAALLMPASSLITMGIAAAVFLPRRN